MSGLVVMMIEAQKIPGSIGARYLNPALYPMKEPNQIHVTVVYVVTIVDKPKNI